MRCFPNKAQKGIQIIFLLMALPAAVVLWKGPATAGQKDLTIALLPIVDALPFYVAEAEGYFAKSNISVIGLSVNSGIERDQLMQAGEIDGMLNEMMTAANFNRRSPTVTVVSAARSAAAGYPLFRLLSAPNSDIRTLPDLTGAVVAVSKNTIIEYVTDRILAARGMPAAAVKKRSVPMIAERFHLLIQGQIAAATLPDPLAKSAMIAGAHLIVDDGDHPTYSMSVLTFSNSVLHNRPDAIRRFLAAWDQAAGRLNADAERYRALMLKKIRVPKNVQRTFAVPPFSRRQIPTADQWQDVMTWMVEKGLLKAPLAYESSVTDRFLD